MVLPCLDLIFYIKINNTTNLTLMQVATKIILMNVKERE